MLHAPLLFVPVYRGFDDESDRRALIRFDVAPESPGSRTVSMPYRSPAPPDANPSRAPASARRAPARIRAAPTGARTVARDTASGRPAPAHREVPSDLAVEATPPAGGAAPSRRIGPAYVSGRLWVRPLPVSPQELAAQLREKTHMEKVDSAVHAIIQDYLDRMAVEEAGRPEPLPSWTTKIAGKTVGVDSRWIYLGPIRVPAFLLGLIPLNVQANPTQAEMNRRLSVMREDLFDAARRSANYSDFKAAVTKLREEKQRERDLQKAQRTTPSEQGEPR